MRTLVCLADVALSPEKLGIAPENEAFGRQRAPVLAFRRSICSRSACRRPGCVIGETTGCQVFILTMLPIYSKAGPALVAILCDGPMLIHEGAQDRV